MLKESKTTPKCHNRALNLQAFDQQAGCPSHCSSLPAIIAIVIASVLREADAFAIVCVCMCMHCMLHTLYMCGQCYQEAIRVDALLALATQCRIHIQQPLYILLCLVFVDTKSFVIYLMQAVHGE